MILPQSRRVVLVITWLAPLWFCLINASNAWAIPVADLDRENGFRGIPFGTDFQSLPPGKFILVFSAAGGRYQVFTRKDEKLEYEGAPLTEVRYHFFDGLFRKAFLEFKDSAACDLAAGNLHKRYDTGDIMKDSDVLHNCGTLVDFYFQSRPDEGQPYVCYESVPLERLFRLWVYEGPDPELERKRLP
jgi:hypothetical protein